MFLIMLILGIGWVFHAESFQFPSKMDIPVMGHSMKWIVSFYGHVILLLLLCSVMRINFQNWCSWLLHLELCIMMVALPCLMFTYGSMFYAHAAPIAKYLEKVKQNLSVVFFISHFSIDLSRACFKTLTFLSLYSESRFRECKISF